MTPESDFPNIEKDPEKFAASIRANSYGVKNLVDVILKKLGKKESWGKENISSLPIPPVPKESFDQTKHSGQ
jgi:hypothetical protein